MTYQINGESSEHSELLVKLIDAFSAFNRSAERLSQTYEQLASQYKNEDKLHLQSVDQALLIGALESINTGIVVVDKDDKIVFANHIARELVELSNMIGLKHQEVFGQPCFVQMSQDNSECTRYYKVFTNRQKVKASIYPILSDVGRSRKGNKKQADIIGAVEIISDANLREINSNAKVNSVVYIPSSQILDTTTEIVKNIAQIIRNPLSAIQLFVELLKQDLSNSQDNREEVLEDIISSVYSLEAVISNLLSIAQLPATHMRIVDLVEVVRETLNFVESVIKQQGIEIRRSFSHSSLYCFGDMEQLKQVCLNLILNSIQAMPTGGVISVKLYPTEDNNIVLVIEDTGIGIPEEHIDKIFMPFFTTKETGTGLGLYVVYRLIKAHNGQIFVTSSLGKGTSVTIRIPAYIT